MIYDLLFKASAEALLTFAADPKHLGARIAVTTVPEGGAVRAGDRPSGGRV